MHQIDFLATDETINQIEHKFQLFLDAYANVDFLSLPVKERYYDVFLKCYRANARRRFVLKRADFCPTHEQCSIPKVPGLNCSVATVPYAYGTLSPGITVHYPRDPGSFHLSSDGC